MARSRRSARSAARCREDFALAFVLCPAYDAGLEGCSARHGSRGGAMLYVFDNYELDTGLYELRRAGIPVKLEPRVFNVLAYLVQHRERVVTKQELCEHLWPGQFVGDAAV